MMDDEQNTSDLRTTRVPSNAVTVPDATHTRFRKPMCRCSDEGHSAFALNKLHHHFSNFNHKSVNLCVLCGSNEVYEYYFTVDRFTKRIFHNCSPSKPKKTTSVPADNSNDNDTSAPQPISQSPEIKDAESSGIGTGFSSMVSIFNGRNEDRLSTDGLPGKSSCSLSDSMPREGSSPGSSQRNNK